MKKNNWKMSNVYSIVKKKKNMWIYIFAFVTIGTFVSSLVGEYHFYGNEIMPLYFSYITYISVIMFSIFFELLAIAKISKNKKLEDKLNNRYVIIFLAFTSFLVFWAYFVITLPFAIADRVKWYINPSSSPYPSYGAPQLTFWCIMTVMTHLVCPAIMWIYFRTTKYKTVINPKEAFIGFWVYLGYAFIYMILIGNNALGVYTFTLGYSFFDWINNIPQVVLVLVTFPFAYYWASKYILVPRYNLNVKKIKKKRNKRLVKY